MLFATVSLSLFYIQVALTAPSFSYRAGSFQHAGRAIPLARYSVQHTNESGVFNLSMVAWEKERIIKKYIKAPEILGLSRDDSGDLPWHTSMPLDAVPPDLTSDPMLVSPVVTTSPWTLKDFIVGNTDFLYFGQTDMGTPSQPLTVDVDTGSADLWVPVKRPGCPNGYDPSQSSTFKRDRRKVHILYGSGSVSGYLAEDVVTIASLTVKNQSFIVAQNISNDFDGYPNDGIIGMAFGVISMTRQPTFFENLLKESKLENPFFSVHLVRGQEKGSEVCFGCYDQAKTTGNISWVPLKSKSYWAVGLDAFFINGDKTDVSVPLIAAIDTGTTFIHVSRKVAEEFYDQLPGSALITEGVYTYPCAMDLMISLSFGGSPFSIHPSDFNLGRIDANSTECVSGILPVEGFPDELVIVGDEFLKSWYSVYDYSGNGRVGFAPSINNRN